MCALLGLAFNAPVTANLSFRGFSPESEYNPDGWGVARFEGKACQVFKEPCRADESALAKFVGEYPEFRSELFVAHVRAASCGSINLANTHPFVRTFRGGEVALAHNGTLSEFQRAEPKLAFHPVGQTDSEWLLCALLTRMSRERVAWTDFADLEELLRGFNRLGRMNLLISEVEHLYAYRDQSGYNGLSLLERQWPFGVVEVEDPRTGRVRVDLSQEKRPELRGFVVATRPVTDEAGWREMVPGRLMVFRHGACVYGGDVTV
jgi:glutamine amidotransferase